MPTPENVPLWATARLLIAIVAVMAMLWLLIAMATRTRATSRLGHITTFLAAAIVLGVDLHLLLGSETLMRNRRADLAAAEKDPKALRIQVQAHQWSWAIRYAGPDHAFATPDDIVLLDEIVIPTGVPVVVALSARDVIHSFHVPALGIKVDAIPRHKTKFSFRTKDATVWEIACAEHCGAGHFLMSGMLRAVSPFEYERWFAQQAKLSALAYNPADKQAHWGWPWADF